MLKVAIFPSSSQIGAELISALSYKKEINIVRVSSNKNDINSDSFLIDVNNIKFIDSLNALIDKEKIDLIYPAHDLVIKKLLQNSEKINCEIVSSIKETIDLTLNKRTTYTYLNDLPFIPTIYYSIDQVDNFPVFVKPSFSYGSKNAFKVNNKNSLRNVIDASNDDWLICEYLSGKEYTVDCYTDSFGNLNLVSPRLRVKIRQGISSETTFVKDNCKISEITKIAKEINSRIKFRGCWFFQVKENSESILKLLEIAPRPAGSSSLTRLKFLNTPYLTVLEFYLKKEVKIDFSMQNNIDKFIEIRKLVYLTEKKEKYPKHIFIDFDDTLTQDNYLNIKLLSLLFFMKLNKAKIYLITRNQDIYSNLINLGIRDDFFEEIKIVSNGLKKSSFISFKSQYSIFIDDSYTERIDIKSIIKIDSFDVSEAICYMEGLYEIKRN